MTEIAAMLAELRVQFAAKLPARLEAIGEAVEIARTDPAQLSQLRHLVHQLRGSSGSYGLMTASEQLGRIEAMLDSGDWDAIAAAVRGVER